MSLKEQIFFCEGREVTPTISSYSEVWNVNFTVYVNVLFYWGSVTKYHRLGGLSNRNLFSQSSGG